MPNLSYTWCALTENPTYLNMCMHTHTYTSTVQQSEHEPQGVFRGERWRQRGVLEKYKRLAQTIP